MHNNSYNTTLKSYVIGFILSIVLSLGAYSIVTQHMLKSDLLLTAIIGLALIQLVVQLLFFLHMGRESKPRWNLVFFISTVGIILIVVIGSIWIMNHLNYNMTPQKIDQYVQNQDGL